MEEVTLETTFEPRVNRTPVRCRGEDSSVEGGEACGAWASRWHRLCGVAGPPTGRGEWGLEKSGEMKGGRTLSSKTKSQDVAQHVITKLVTLCCT